jgi:hypothetical protein
VYETKIVDSPWAVRKSPPYQLTFDRQSVMVFSGAAARAPFRATGAQKFTRPDLPDGAAAATVSDDPYVIAGVDDLAARPELGTGLAKADAFAALARHLALHPEDRGRLQVVPATEAAAGG